MSIPQNSFRTLPQPQKQPIGSKKSKTDPNINSKSNVRIEGHIENESYLTKWVDPKTVFELFPNPHNSPKKAPKSKILPKN